MSHSFILLMIDGPHEAWIRIDLLISSEIHWWKKMVTERWTDSRTHPPLEHLNREPCANLIVCPAFSVECLKPPWRTSSLRKNQSRRAKKNFSNSVASFSKKWNTCIRVSDRRLAYCHASGDTVSVSHSGLDDYGTNFCYPQPSNSWRNLSPNFLQHWTVMLNTWKHLKFRVCPPTSPFRYVG